MSSVMGLAKVDRVQEGQPVQMTGRRRSNSEMVVAAIGLVERRISLT